MKRQFVCIAALAAVWVWATDLRADAVPEGSVERMEEGPKALDNVGVDEKLAASSNLPAALVIRCTRPTVSSWSWACARAKCSG